MHFDICLFMKGIIQYPFWRCDLAMQNLVVKDLQVDRIWIYGMYVLLSNRHQCIYPPFITTENDGIVSEPTDMYGPFSDNNIIYHCKMALCIHRYFATNSDMKIQNIWIKIDNRVIWIKMFISPKNSTLKVCNL